MAKLLIFILVGGAGLYWYFSPEEWTAFIYPDKNDLSQVEEVGTFPELAECRDMAELRLAKLGSLDSGDYECGLNCNIDQTLAVQVCEKTSR